MLVATDLWKSYGDKVVVASVSLDVAAGEIDDGRNALWPHIA